MLFSSSWLPLVGASTLIRGTFVVFPQPPFSDYGHAQVYTIFEILSSLFLPLRNTVCPKTARGVPRSPYEILSPSDYSAGQDYACAKEQDLRQNLRIAILSFRKSCSEMGHKRLESP
jgi:hypothetical protein